MKKQTMSTMIGKMYVHYLTVMKYGLKEITPLTPEQLTHLFNTENIELVEKEYKKIFKK